MKSKLFTCLFMLLTLYAFPQQKFIEVTVSDTAWVTPDNFVYRITVIANNDDMTDTLRYTNPTAFKEKLDNEQSQHATSLDSMSQKIKKAGFKILAPTLGEAFQYVGNNEYKWFSIDVLTGTVDSLKMLHDLVSKNKTLLATVEAAFTKNETIWYQRLYKKLFAAATTKAIYIAGLGGKKIGQVISIRQNEKERAKNATGGWAIYPPLSDLANSVIPGWHTTVSNKNDYLLSAKLETITASIVSDYIIQDSMTIRFSIE